MSEARLVRVRGEVRGVGFRFFVCSLARELGLNGRVQRASGEIVIEIEGSHESLEAFQEALARDHPPRASITEITVEPAQANRYSSFKIEAGESG